MISDFLKYYENREARKQNKKSKGVRYGRCTVCSYKKRLVEHHFRKGAYRRDKDNKTFWVCLDCHYYIHNFSDKKFFEETGKELKDFIYKKTLI